MATRGIRVAGGDRDVGAIVVRGAHAVRTGVPVPGFAAALSYYDTIRAPRTNAALTQGLRDFFGAHTYRRVDKEGTFHTNWSTDGAEVRED